MQACGEERDRSPVGVVGGVHHELIIKGQNQILHHAHGVEGLDNFLLAIIELTVANQNSEAAGGKVVAVVF